MFRKCTFLFAMAWLAGSAQATTVGYDVDPGGLLWNRGDANTGWASFDSFAATTFSGLAPESSFGITSPLLDQSEAVGTPGGVYGSGDRIYFHVSPSHFTLAGSTAFEFKTFVLQIKEHNGSSYGAPANALSPTLNGLSFDSSSSSSFMEGAATQTVYTFTWQASLESQSFTNFSLEWSHLGAVPASVDGVQIDVAAVPEPSSGMLIGVALLGFGMNRFRRGSLHNL